MISLKESIKQDPYYKNYLKDEELDEVFDRIETFLKSVPWGKEAPLHKSLKGHVAGYIRFLSLKGGSCRWLAEICFDPSNPRHGVQMDGRDLRRWAAIQLNELFEDSALVPKYQDYWHEY